MFYYWMFWQCTAEEDEGALLYVSLLFRMYDMRETHKNYWIIPQYSIRDKMWYAVINGIGATHLIICEGEDIEGLRDDFLTWIGWYEHEKLYPVQ